MLHAQGADPDVERSVRRAGMANFTDVHSGFIGVTADHCGKPRSAM